MKGFVIIGCFLSATAVAQDANVSVQRGNELYRQGQYDAAAAEYQAALKIKQDNTTKFNLASAMARQGKNEEAKKAFREISASDAKADLKAKAYYNEGAILSKEKKLEESIEAYKNALRRDPNDQQARENLQKALLELKKKNPPKPKEDDKKKKEQQQKQQQQPKMSQQQAEQRLKLLEQKEKEVQQRLQKEKSKSGGGQGKDW